MMQAEVIDALSASSWPGATAAKTAAIAAFKVRERFLCVFSGPFVTRN
jgi:hypothetical protein|eukprot:COSAG06_NODE_2534_length_6710_cov_23.487521_8_plen_48_part_00